MYEISSLMERMWVKQRWGFFLSTYLLSSYILTYLCPFLFFIGMSEKLQSIPKETIQVTPKEVVLPPDQNGFTNFEKIPPNEFNNFENIPPDEFTKLENIPSGPNSTELRGEQLPPDGKSDHDENDEIPNALNSEIHIPNSLNDEIHIPTNTISSTIEPTNDEPKTAFDTANSIDVEQNSTIEPNNFDKGGSNSIKNGLKIIDEQNIDELKVSKFQRQIVSSSFEPKNRTKLFFDFCPKDLKLANKKIMSLLY